VSSSRSIATTPDTACITATTSLRLTACPNARASNEKLDRNAVSTAARTTSICASAAIVTVPDSRKNALRYESMRTWTCDPPTMRIAASKLA